MCTVVLLTLGGERVGPCRLLKEENSRAQCIGPETESFLVCSWSNREPGVERAEHARGK